MKSSVFALVASLAYCQTPLTTPVIVYPKADDSAGGQIRFMEKRANGTNYVGLRADDDIPADIVFRIPRADGSPGKCWGYSSPGVVAWVDCGGASLPVIDTTPIVKGSDDPTKQMRFSVGGLTTNTTRVLAVQDTNYILAGINIAQAFTQDQSFASGNINIVAPYSNIGQSRANITFTGSKSAYSYYLTFNPNLGTFELYDGYNYKDIWITSTSVDLSFGDNLIPNSSYTWNLGSSFYQWKDIYYSGNLTGGSATINNLTVTGTCTGCSSLPVVDTTSIVKGSNDSTKQMRFAVGTLTTGTTRVLTVQDTNYILAGTNIVQSFTQDQSFASGNVNIVAPSYGSSSRANLHFTGPSSPYSYYLTFNPYLGTFELYDTYNSKDIWITSTSTDLSFGDNLIPTASATWNLGSSSYQWQNVYYSGTLTGGSASINGLTLSGNLSGTFSLTGNMTVSSGNFYNRTFSGAPNCTGVTNGWTGVDTTNNRLYVCIGGSARYATLN
jgi:hypothetical protein